MNAISQLIETAKSYDSENFVFAARGSSTPVHISSKGSVDRIEVSVDYCQVKVAWLFLFDRNDLSFPPDIILPNSWPEYITDIAQFEIMKNWKLDNCVSLLRALLVLLNRFKEYQKNLFSTVTHERIRFEFEVMQNDENIQYLVVGDLEPEYHCMIPLEIKFDIHENKNTSFDPNLHLFITWKYSKGRYLTRTDISSSIPTAQAFLEDYKLPKWTKESCITNYRIETIEGLGNHVELIKHRFQLFKNLKRILGSPLEYDSQTYKKISFLVFEEFLPYVVICQLPVSFPLQAPKVTVMTLFQCTAGLPRFETSKAFHYGKYNSEWKSSTIALRISKMLPGLIQTVNRET